jgi:hypothetical protein
LVKVQHHEYCRNEIGQETGILRWAKFRLVRPQGNIHARKYEENEAIGENHLSEAPSTHQIAGGGRCDSNELVYVQ